MLEHSAMLETKRRLTILFGRPNRLPWLGIAGLLALPLDLAWYALRCWVPIVIIIIIGSGLVVAQ